MSNPTTIHVHVHGHRRPAPYAVPDTVTADEFASTPRQWTRRQLASVARRLLLKIEDLRRDLANAAARERELTRRLERALTRDPQEEPRE